MRTKIDILPVETNKNAPWWGRISPKIRYIVLAFAPWKIVTKRRYAFESPREIGNRDSIIMEIPLKITYLETNQPY